MSREDDFDDIMDSPDELDAGQDDTSEPLLDDALEETPADEPDEVIATLFIEETDEGELAPPPPGPAVKRKAPARKAAKKVAKKTAASKPKTTPKAKPKKKAAKITRKPAAPRTTAKKKTAKKPAAKKPAAKKKTSPVAKKKKSAAKARRKR